jgi:hypothetical protein
MVSFKKGKIMKSFNEWIKGKVLSENWDWGSGEGRSVNTSQLKEGDIVIFHFGKGTRVSLRPMSIPPRYGVVVGSTTADRIQSNHFGDEGEPKDDEVPVLYSLFGEPKIINVKTQNITKEYDATLVSKFINDGHHQSSNKYYISSVDEGTYSGISELVKMAIKEGVKFSLNMPWSKV